MEKWGIIGGTFDPIHLAHIYIAQTAKEKLNLQKVIFMPAGSPPHKSQMRITEASVRLKMVKAAIEGIEGFEVSDYEIQKKTKSYTYQTLQYLKSENKQIYFITGADCLINIENWKNPDIILKSCKLVVVTRPGFEIAELEKQRAKIQKKYNTEIIFLDVEGIDISSTEIRKRVLEQKSIEEFLPKKVINIINEQRLYRG
jgi:nicotinate-nucleotide adenylyltransferase